MIQIRNSYFVVIKSVQSRSLLQLALFGLLPARILVKFINSFGCTFHGTKDRDGGGKELLLYLQSFWLSGAMR